MDDLLYVLAGGVIALVSSVVVTWIQGTYARRASSRDAARDAIHELWRLFIAERDATDSERLLDGGTSRGLAEAEMLTVTISDRRTRERVRTIVHLLRECDLPEMEELSGIRAARARQILCEHALDVFGTHLRNERLPALPSTVQKMQSVEDEALNIHAGGPARPQLTESVPRGKVRRKPRTTQPGAESTAENASSTS